MTTVTSGATPALSIKARQQAMWALGRLRRRRHDTADRRRAALRGRGHPRRRARARRGGGQRQRDAGGRAPLRAGHLDRLRPLAARTRTRPRRGGGAGRRVRGRGCRRAAVAGGELRRHPLDVRRDVRARSRASARRDAARVPARRPHRPGLMDAGRLPWSDVQGHRPRTCRRRPACPLRCCGERRPTSKSCSKARVDHPRGSVLFVPVRSPEHFVEIFRTFYGPVLKAFAAIDADRQAVLEADLLGLLRKLDRGDATGLVVPGEYLETVIVR